ncbi:MAG: type II toxin-antitoxin system VapC family toxin [Chloroflexi bacterium]|nr:type II toxin-antitoxin system VapC family toxin [Chloroflexota bacterium]
MKVLWDTHAFLWFVDDNPKLSRVARHHIENIDNDRVLSIASVWEIAIKVSMRKLEIGQPLATFIPTQLELSVSDLLPVTLEHVAMVARLPFHHRDPFDRMLIAQSLVEGVPIVSSDGIFDAYGVARIW